MPDESEQQKFVCSTAPTTLEELGDVRQKAVVLRRLAKAISTSRGQDDLAIDILVNRAAFPGEQGRVAHTALWHLYEHPETGDARADEHIRACLLRSARAACELALITAPAIQGEAIDLPLSLLVATMGRRCPVPKGKSKLNAAIQAHVDRRIRIHSRGWARLVASDQPQIGRLRQALPTN